MMKPMAADDDQDDLPLRINVERLDILSDEILAKRAQMGSHLCFEELVRRFQIPLLRFVQRKVGRRSDAEDIVQESFLRAFRKLDRYRDAWSFRTWIFTITYRIALNHARQARRNDDARTLDESTSGSVAADTTVETNEERSLLWSAARKVLSEEQFATIWLYYVEEMSGSQIANILGRSGVGVRATLFRARRKLMAHLDPGEMMAVGDGVADGPRKGEL